VSAETESKLDPKYPTTADLVVEVISPGSAIYDRNTKADTYAALGVKEVWLVDEDGQSLEIRELEGLRRVFSESEIVTSAVLPGLSFPLRSLFED
jgi:Uma2 family endonuclease